MAVTEQATIRWYQHENLGTLLKIVGRDIERKPQWKGRIVGLELYGDTTIGEAPALALTLCEERS